MLYEVITLDRFVRDVAERGQHFSGFLRGLHGVDNDNAIVSFEHDGVGEAIAYGDVHAIA